MRQNQLKLVVCFLLTFTFSSSQETTKSPTLTPDQVTDTQINLEFERWRKLKNRCYSDDEILYRRQMFAENYRKIIAHNNDKTKTFTMALNDYSDMNFLEFSNRFLIPDLGKNIDISSIRNTKEDEEARNQEILDAEKHLCQQKEENIFTKKNRVLPPPPSCDWRPFAVNPTINAVSFAASVTGMAEGYHYIQTSNLVKYCEQQIKDCCTYFGFGGSGQCKWHYQAVNYVYKFGLLTCSQYYAIPPNSLTSCRLLHPSNGFYFNQRSYPLPSFINTFKSAVCSQPISVAIHFSDDMQNYSGGVYNGNCSSNPGSANYFLLIVGYFSNIWVCKASQSPPGPSPPNWGQLGYIYLPFSPNTNKCGVLNYGLKAWHT